jgi:hypothetical protein|nr:MAG TPA: Protein of unknown function (DUF3277) [Caudoviricetes sp.]
MTTYDAKDCTIMVNGVYITGLGEDMVTGEKDEDNYETSVGAQGDVCISMKNDPLGTITVTVQPTSPQKGFLLDLAKIRDPFSLWVTNKVLGERMGGTKALLKKAPEITRGAEAEDMEFEFGVFDYVCEATA